MPEEVTVIIRPAAVLRSVLAHVIAAKQRTDNVRLDAMIRAYLNGSVLGPQVRVYLWPYPFYEIVVARDFMFVDYVNDYSFDHLASVIKFFPLAFLVTEEEKEMPFDRLDQYAGYSIDDEVSYKINMGMIMDPTWPERPERMRSVSGAAAFTEAVSTFEGRFGRALMAANFEDQSPQTRPDASNDGPCDNA